MYVAEMRNINGGAISWHTKSLTNASAAALALPNAPLKRLPKAMASSKSIPKSASNAVLAQVPAP